MLDFIERTFYWIGSNVLEGDVHTHCQLRAAIDAETFVTTSDDLMTAIEVRGARKLVGELEFEIQSAAVARTIAGVMRAGNGAQHSFGISFRSSPQSAGRLLREIVGPSVSTARRLGVRDEDCDYFRDQMQALVSRCSEESAYLVVLTHGAGLSPAERKRAAQWREEANAKVSKATGGARLREEFAQVPRPPVPALIPRHSAMVANLIKSLEADAAREHGSTAGGCGLLVRTLEVGEAANLMRRQFDASDFPSSWQPRFHGDPGTLAAVKAPRVADRSELMPVPLSRQMITEGFTEQFGDAEIGKRGKWHYASLVMDVLPAQGSEKFDALARRVGRQIPWSCSFELTPNGVQVRKMDQTYAGFVGGFGDHNKRVRAAWRTLKEMHNAGVYVGALRVVFTTWGPTEAACVDNLAFLKSSLESWDSAVVSNETGTPALAALCSAAGFTKRSPAPYMPGPLEEVCRMLPMFRPASVWSNGQLIAHTSEGRPYPVKFGSMEQSFWGVIGFAPSGSGKSFLLSMINMGILTTPGLDELPYMVIVDVGPSSRLVLDLVKDMVPEHLKRQIATIRIRNHKDYTVNPFDTQHGCDRPTQVDKDFQVNVVSTLCPNLGNEGGVYIGQVIDEAYRMFGRSSPSQRVWQSSFDLEIHEKLAGLGYEFTERTRVWDVVDELFDRGLIEDSACAQRYAVPRLSDLVSAAQSKTIQDNYKTAKAANGELMVNVFVRSITAAQNEYTLVSGFTRFDVGNARALSIDLEEVVGSMTSEEGRRRSGLMFLFARRLGARNFFLRWDEVGDIVPQRYREYQKRRIDKISESLKFLEYDEKHYTTGVGSVDAQIGVDLRVGRKYKTVTMMFSQLLADFPPEAVENCYTYFILGTGTSNSSRDVQDTFGLSGSEIQAIQSECTGPGRVFALFKTNKGGTSQVLHTTAGPFMQWSFSTSTDDAKLRAAVTSRIGYLEGLRLLAKSFPAGSARKEIERYMLQRGENDRDKRPVSEIFADKLLRQERAAVPA